MQLKKLKKELTGNIEEPKKKKKKHPSLISTDKKKIAPDGRVLVKKKKVTPDGRILVPKKKVAPDGRILVPKKKVAPDGRVLVPKKKVAPDGRVLVPKKRKSLPAARFQVTKRSKNLKIKMNIRINSFKKSIENRPETCPWKITCRKKGLQKSRKILTELYNSQKKLCKSLSTPGRYILYSETGRTCRKHV